MKIKLRFSKIKLRFSKIKLRFSKSNSDFQKSNSDFQNQTPIFNYRANKEYEIIVITMSNALTNRNVRLKWYSHNCPSLESKNRNIKISAVRSLADICLLHVLYWYSYCVIQLGVSVTQYALIARRIYSSSQSVIFLRVCQRNTLLPCSLFLSGGFYFHAVARFSFFQCGDFGHLSLTCTKPADTSKSNARRD